MNECLLCGDKFPYCGHCNDDRYDAWRDVACSWSHYVFLKPIIEYTRKVIDKNEARTRLNDAKTVYGDVKMIPAVKKVYNEITYVSEPAKKIDKKSEKKVAKKEEID